MSKIYNDINLGILSLRLVNKKILDVGCGTGLLGAQLKLAGNFVYGIDINDTQLKIAAKKLDGIKKVDITKTKPNLPKDFEVIIFADILEHVIDPTMVLKMFRRYLAPSGKIIISLPNIACYNIRLGLLFGKFDYQDYGVMDRSHLRFFTNKSAKYLVREAGFEIISTDVTPFFLRSIFRFFKKLNSHGTSGAFEENFLKSKTFALYRRWIFPIERFFTRLIPSLLAYQFIIVAQPESK